MSFCRVDIYHNLNQNYFRNRAENLNFASNLIPNA